MSFSQTTKHQTRGTMIGPVTSQEEYIRIHDEKAYDSMGGNSVSGSWMTRDLNTIVEDSTGQVTVSSNQFTLPAGTYRAAILAPSYASGKNLAVLYNITDSEDTLVGRSGFSHSAGDSVPASINGTFTIGATKTFEVRHRVEVTTTDGLGPGQNSVLGLDSSYKNIFTVVELWRLAPPFTTLPGQQKYVLIRDEKSSGTHGGTFTNGDWRTRNLNTLTVDETGQVSLSSNQFTLSAGTYRFSASAPARIVGNHTCRLQNTTDASTVLVGEVCIAGTGGFTVTHSRVEGQFTITASKTFELQHRCATTRATDGFGEAANFASTAEVYATIELLKVA